MSFTIKPGLFYYLALAGFFGLFTLLMLWNTMDAAASRFPVSLALLISITPLLLPMRGLLNRHRRSCAWASYISLIYFIHGSVEAYANVQERLFASTEVLFSLLLFFGTTLYLRFDVNAD